MTFDQLPKAVADLQDSVNEIKRLLMAQTQGTSSNPIIPESDKVLTVAQAASFLNTSPGAIYQLVHKSAIPYSKKGRLYFSEKELRSWIQSSRRQTVTEIQVESLASLAIGRTSI